MYAQDPFSGTFMTQDATLTLRLKPMPEAYHGTLQSTEAIYALSATKKDQELTGTVYTNTGNYDFKATVAKGILTSVSEGKAYYFYRVSYDHQLAEVDLSPYFQTAEKKADDTTEKSSTEDKGDKGTLFDYIAGSQLVFYQRTSYVNDNTASSITYVNFCADGRFNLNYDGSFSVEGDYGGNAHGVSRGSNYGTWQVTEDKDNPVVTLNFGNGEKGIYPVNIAHLAAGRWRIGNTQYALQPNKAICN